MADRNEMAEATRAPVILGGIVAASVLCTFFTAARLWVRGKILGRLHADDWLVVASVVSPVFFFLLLPLLHHIRI